MWDTCFERTPASNGHLLRTEGTAIDTLVQRKERFRRLAAIQLPRLYAIARRLTGDDAEDAVQDTLLKGYQSFDQLHDDRAAGAWLVSILINVVRDRGRAKTRALHEVNLDEVEEFSLYKQIAREDPSPTLTHCTWISCSASPKRT